VGKITIRLYIRFSYESDKHKVTSEIKKRLVFAGCLFDLNGNRWTTLICGLVLKNYHTDVGYADQKHGLLQESRRDKTVITVSE